MYILVTHFESHWDRLKDNQSRYRNDYIKANVDNLINGTKTIFVKIDGANRIINIWEGKVENIVKLYASTKFNVADLQPLAKQEWKKYEGLSSGWYVKDEADNDAEDDSDIFKDQSLMPAFVKNLDSLNSMEFEQATHLIIRLLGVHRAYKFPSEDQAGEADGFFRISNLCVIYDCTLREKKDYEIKKKKQITNYCNRMHNAELDIQSDIKEHLEGQQKQVWIITRKGRSHIFNSDNRKDTVIVKEVSIFDLKDIYLRRLKVDMTENELSNLLSNLGQ